MPCLRGADASGFSISTAARTHAARFAVRVCVAGIFIFPDSRFERARLAAGCVGYALCDHKGRIDHDDNVRKFAYRTETDFMPRWETRTNDLSKLDSVDLIAVYWAGKAIAHIMVSFGFREKTTSRYRSRRERERRELFDSSGFFRQYELLLRRCQQARRRWRQNHLSPTAGGRLYLPGQRAVKKCAAGVSRLSQAMNELHERPSYYNTLTTNCTTSI